LANQLVKPNIEVIIAGPVALFLVWAADINTDADTGLGIGYLFI
jgi:hypothetical protein